MSVLPFLYVRILHLDAKLAGFGKPHPAAHSHRAMESLVGACPIARECLSGLSEPLRHISPPISSMHVGSAVFIVGILKLDADLAGSTRHQSRSMPAPTMRH